LVAFGAVSYDDMSAATSSTNFTLHDLGDYQLNCWLQFDIPGNQPDGHREIILRSVTNGDIARTQIPATIDETTAMHISFPHRSTTVNEVVQVYARSGDDVNVAISAGAFVLTRTGSGPQGPVGPQGPQGITGAMGPVGPQGPAGNANDGFATYADLL
jgi:hypothetical protein